MDGGAEAGGGGLAIVVVLAPVVILGAAGVGVGWGAAAGTARLRRWTQVALGLAAAAALGACWLLGFPQTRSAKLLDGPGPWDLEVYWDPLAALVLLLVTNLGLVIGRFSLRQLDGDPGQARFMRWLLWTLAFTTALIVAGNLWMVMLAWMWLSFGLHQLLTYYSDRSWALWTARKKFLISRMGDLFLLAGLGTVYVACGTWSFSALFAMAQDWWAATEPVPPLAGVASVLFALAAMTKSAQLPFHSWLPDTMETPTPVSAFMHAGVINAGGYLILRLSPFISWSTVAMSLLVCVGGLTAIVAGMVMMTQTSVKRALAYSTIAQMGFMMLQIGVGAFAAAVLHLLAHSLYKSYAFLGSGSVLHEPLGASPPARERPRFWANWPAVAGGVCAVGMVAGVAWWADYDLAHKPSAAVFGLILALAVSQFLNRAFAEADLATAGWGLLCGLSICGLYFGGVRGLEWILADSFRGVASFAGAWPWTLAAIVGAGFAGLFWLQIAIESQAGRDRLRTWYVHAANGFYLDIPMRHMTARVWGRLTPTP